MIHTRLISCLLIALTCSLSAFADGPKLVFEKNLHEFGDIKKGESVDAIFHFKNEGDAPLEILSVKASCGCTTPVLEKNFYEPGESGVITATFNSTRFSDKISKNVTVTSNDSKNQSIRLSLKGNVITDILFKPASLFFPKVLPGQNVTRTIQVSTSVLDRIELSNIKFSKDFVSLSQTATSDKLTTLEVSIDTSKLDNQKQRHSAVITLTTNSSAQSQIRIPVTINMDLALKASPKSAYFFASKQGVKREVKVRLLSREKETFEIKDLSSSLKYISARTDADNKSIVITLAENAPMGKFKGSVTVSTSLMDITIPIRGSVIR